MSGKHKDDSRKEEEEEDKRENERNRIHEKESTSVSGGLKCTYINFKLLRNNCWIIYIPKNTQPLVSTSD